MKGYDNWSYRPYAPLMYPLGDIHVCRIAPGKDGFSCQWLPLESGGMYTVLCGLDGEPMTEMGTTRACSFTVGSLVENRDYRFQITCGERVSRIRLVRTGHVEGVVVNYLHPRDDCFAFSGQYLGSPCLIRCPDGSLLASMDVFAGGAPQNLTLIFRSLDNGTSWEYVTDLFPCFWGRLFVHREMVYMLACSTEYGDILIGRSDDCGNTFARPTVLLRGSGKSNVPGVHKNPQPLLRHKGRLWGTLEWGTWAKRFHAPMVMSASVDADLLRAESWHFTDPTPYDPNWPGVAGGDSAGNIEGTLAITPAGALLNIMRYDMINCSPNYGRVLAYRVNTEDFGAPLAYSHAIRLDGNHSKFMIRKDQVTGKYLTIICRILNAQSVQNRNLLSLMASDDLENWALAADLIDCRGEDPEKNGYQYAAFFIEGEDLLYLCRTAINEPDNYHDSNYSVYHRVKGFRRFLPQ